MGAPEPNESADKGISSKHESADVACVPADVESFDAESGAYAEVSFT